MLFSPIPQGKEEGKHSRIKKRRFSIIGLQHVELLEAKSEFALRRNFRNLNKSLIESHFKTELEERQNK